MPPQDEETQESPNSLPQYTDDDLEILHEIVALATTIPGTQSFRSIWKAYDTVLAARNIDPALDSVYFRFILQLQGAPGEDLKEKFIFMLDKLGVDIEDTRYTDFSTVPEEITTEFNRLRFGEARERRERARQSASSAEDGEEEYLAEDEKETGTAPKTSRVDVRRSLKDPRDAAVRAANAAAQQRRLEVRERRAGVVSNSDTGHNSSADDVRSTEGGKFVGVANLFYRAIVLRKCFHRWKGRTVQQVVRRIFFERQAEVFGRASLMWHSVDVWKERRWFAVVEQHTENQYNLSLLAKVWKVWVEQTAAVVQRTHEEEEQKHQQIRERVLQRRYGLFWVKLFRDNREARRFQLSRKLQKWRDALKRLRLREQRTEAEYNAKLVQAVYWQWYFAHLDVAVPARYVERLARIALSEWRDRTDGLMVLHAMANGFRERKALQRTFSHWVHRTDRCMEAQDQAIDNLDWHRRQTVFDSWRRQTALAPLIRAMQEVVTERVAYEQFTGWRARAKNEIAAAEMRKQNLVRKALRIWRLRLRHDIMAEHHQMLIRRNTLQQWVRQERLQLLARTHNRQLARGIIQLLTQKCKEKKDKLRRAYRQAVVLHRRNIARAIFRFWYQLLQHKSRREQAAITRYQTTLFEKALFAWRSRAQVVEGLEEEAFDAFYYIKGNQALARWKIATTESKKRRLKEAYYIVARNRKRRTALDFFTRWRSRGDHLREHSQVANEHGNEKLRFLGRDILIHWSNQIPAAMEQWGKAENFYYHRLAGMALGAWTESYEGLQKLEHEGQKVLHARNLGLALKYLKKWDNRYALWGWRGDDATRVLERNESAKALSIFREWRDKAHRRQQQRDNSEAQQSDGFSDATVIHSGSGALTPPSLRPFKTPGWKTGGGTRRRGVLGNRSLVVTTPLGSPGSPLKRFNMFGRSALRRVVEPEDEDDGTLVGSGSVGQTIGTRSVTGGL